MRLLSQAFTPILRHAPWMKQNCTWLEVGGMSSRKGARPSAPIQRSITSFLGSKKPPPSEPTPLKQRHADNGADKAETLTHACEDRPRRSPDRSDGGGVAILPLKRARSDEALPAPQETPSKKRNGPDQALLHDKFQRKLVSGQAATRGERAAEAKQSVTVTGTPPPGAKLTPLEQQVTDLKRQHPGVLLVVEVRRSLQRLSSCIQEVLIGCTRGH